MDVTEFFKGEGTDGVSSILEQVSWYPGTFQLKLTFSDGLGWSS